MYITQHSKAGVVVVEGTIAYVTPSPYFLFLQIRHGLIEWTDSFPRSPPPNTSSSSS
jgi:hypothetical protein